MNILKLHNPHRCPSDNFSHFQTTRLSPSSFLFLRKPHASSFSFVCRSLSRNLTLKHVKASSMETPTWSNEEKEESSIEESEEYCQYLAEDGKVYQKTLRLVETAMFAAVSGLAYLLSNSLAIENYFGCFFALPTVISSMRWGIAAGRKTTVATAVLLFVLSGPVKALTYLLMYGLLGFAMGSLWRLKASWAVSIFFCSLARAIGAVGYVLVSSFLIGENILALITVNIHASVTYILTNIGIHAIPSMDTIYLIFGTLLFLNCAFFVFLLHILYAVFFTRFGMKASLRLPRWLESAI